MACKANKKATGISVKPIVFRIAEMNSEAPDVKRNPSNEGRDWGYIYRIIEDITVVSMVF